MLCPTKTVSLLVASKEVLATGSPPSSTAQLSRSFSPVSANDLADGCAEAEAETPLEEEENSPASVTNLINPPLF